MAETAPLGAQCSRATSAPTGLLACRGRAMSGHVRGASSWLLLPGAAPAGSEDHECLRRAFLLPVAPGGSTDHVCLRRWVALCSRRKADLRITNACIELGCHSWRQAGLRIKSACGESFSRSRRQAGLRITNACDERAERAVSRGARRVLGSRMPLASVAAQLSARGARRALGSRMPATCCSLLSSSRSAARLKRARSCRPAARILFQEAALERAPLWPARDPPRFCRLGCT